MVGKILCELWGLPDDITNAIFSHHDPSENPSEDVDLIRLIHLSDVYARMTGIGDPGDSIVPEPSRAALTLLGTTQEKIQANQQMVLAELEKMRSDIDGFFTDISKSAGEKSVDEQE